MTTLLPTVRMEGPAALRALAHAFAHAGDFDRFMAGLNAALDHSAAFGKTSIMLDRELADSAGDFPSGVLALPLAEGGKKLGTLRIGADGGSAQFGAQDLHLLSGLAEFLSAALSVSERLQANDRNRERLRFLLNQAPVGIASYGSDRRLVVANDLAIRWLGEVRPPFDDLEKDGGGFHLRAHGKLIYGEARHHPLSGGSEWLVVLHDLTPEQGRLLELIRRETYRALAQKGRFGFALIEAPDARVGVLRRLPELRAALALGETAGPYDAHRVGLVFSEVNSLAMRARLRRLRHVFEGLNGLRMGYAELGRHGATPETLLDAALQNAGPYDEVVRPSVLVHDKNPGVADTLAMMLGRSFHVVKSSEAALTRELLGRETFEGFVAELESRTGPDGAELMRYARSKLPGIRPFFLTARPMAHDWPAEEDAMIFEKPFDASAVTQAVKDKLAD